MIDETTVLKLFNGYDKLLSNRNPKVANENFMKYREVVKNEEIFEYEMQFGVFHDSFSQQGKAYMYAVDNRTINNKEF
ncbi:hypothetical protein [Butyrivibrio fibrisolvens]|uniref:hypothetical protein n=1 Tax=Butyrivibrio fibrisolvens TaxID=831 RepID=UPI000401F1DC|nr:hypothetical protein [Butyrivibrio fibrisolvens]